MTATASAKHVRLHTQGSNYTALTGRTEVTVEATAACLPNCMLSPPYNGSYTVPTNASFPVCCAVCTPFLTHSPSAWF